MKTVGIIAEYNPFHNGHRYHIEKARELAGADGCMVVMSGNFTQRGEPAIADKWTRAEEALKWGADLVAELPFACACNVASNFARGGIDVLVKSGVDAIAFGCECRDPDALRETVSRLQEKEKETARITEDEMKSGCSRAAAHEKAVRKILGDEAADLIKSPNNILAVEYLKRMDFWRKQGLQLQDIPVTRKGANYNGVEDLGEKGFAGASEIRKMIQEGFDAASFVPGSFRHENMESLTDRFFQILRGICLRSRPEELAEIYSVGEGFENRLLREMTLADNYQDLVSRLVSRRYTASAVRRMLVWTLMGMKGNEVDRLLNEGISRVRLLAANSAGREIVKSADPQMMRFVSNVNKEEGIRKGDGSLLEMDIRAADIYNVLCRKKLHDSSDKVRKPAILTP